jgi:SAM-dependent methyltransferase
LPVLRARGGHGRRRPTALQRGGDGHKLNRRVRPVHDDHLPRWQVADGGAGVTHLKCKWMVHAKDPCHAAPMPKNYFDERIAKSYEAKWPELFEPAMVDPVVAFLAELAGTGAAIELGIGTGRIAIPLSQRGVRVHGIDLSPDMIAELRAKPGTDDIGVAVGDFATTRVSGTYTLAYLLRNTIMNLTTQDTQVACFQNVTAHLQPGGCFVIEVGVPGLQRLPPGETVRAFTVTPTHLGFEEYDVATQIAYSHHYWVVDGHLETFSAPFRYVWPSELDLMARLAGMTLRERWRDWTRAPFTSDSGQHVSVWEKTA